MALEESHANDNEKLIDNEEEDKESPGEEDNEGESSSSSGGETLSHYRIINYLEKGSFGDVHLATDLDTGEYVAIKIVDKKKTIGLGSKRKKAVLDELNLLRVSHPAIIELKNFFVTRDYLVLVMEYCAGGDLFQYVVDKDGVPEKNAKFIFRQILDGIQHLHKMNIIHRDLKLENILMKEKGKDVIKITDFGMSRIISRVSLATTQCGTMEYTAPEILQFKPYGQECDYWSLGILLYDLLTTELPFQSVDEILASEHTKVPFDSPRWLTISDSAKDLIRNLLAFDPMTRWTCEQALQSAWLNDCDDVRSPDIHNDAPMTNIAINTNIDANNNHNNGNQSSHSDSEADHANLPVKKRSKKDLSATFGMSLRKRIKVKHPYDV